MKDNIYRKNFIWNSIGSSINAFNSLFFLIIITRINGIETAGVFTFAFSMATLFNIIGIYSGRVYQVTDTDNNTYKDYFINKIITCICMIVIYTIFILINGYNLQKTIILFILCSLKMIEAMAEYFYAYFQQKNDLYKVGISLTIKNVLMLGVFLIINLITKSIILSTISLIISYSFIAIIYDFRYFDFKLLKDKLNKNNLKSIFTKGFFTFCLTFLSFLLINLPRYIVDIKMTDTYNAIFGILIMPATATLLLAQFFIQPSIIYLKEKLANKDIKGFKKIIINIFKVMSVLGVFILLGTHFLGIKILNLVYGIDLIDYRLSLLIIMCGSIFYALVVIISNILVTMRVTLWQVIIYLLALLISYFSSIYLIASIGILGSSISYLITMASIFIMFIILLIISIKKVDRRKV